MQIAEGDLCITKSSMQVVYDPSTGRFVETEVGTMLFTQDEDVPTLFRFCDLTLEPDTVVVALCIRNDKSNMVKVLTCHGTLWCCSKDLEKHK